MLTFKRLEETLMNPSYKEDRRKHTPGKDNNMTIKVVIITQSSTISLGKNAK